MMHAAFTLSSLVVLWSESDSSQYSTGVASMIVRTCQLEPFLFRGICFSQVATTTMVMVATFKNR